MPELSTSKKIDLLQEIDAGNTAHSKIVAFYNFMVTAMHIEPPSDAMADERDCGTCFDATNPSVHHPSSICPRYVINDRESMASLYAMNLSVQYRRIHQAYCDRNYDARQRAKAAVANGTLGPRQKRPEDIPVDCRFSFQKQIRSRTHMVVTKSKTADGSFKHRATIAPMRNDKWLNTSIHSISEVWGANMDWQPILDPGMVIDYMTKYVTKSKLSTTALLNKLVKTVYSDNLAQGRSAQSFLRQSMSKMLGERTMSKQEKCHLVLGIPIVEASHTLENIDLRDNMCKLDFSIQRVQDSEL